MLPNFISSTLSLTVLTSLNFSLSIRMSLSTSVTSAVSRRLLCSTLHVSSMTSYYESLGIHCRVEQIQLFTSPRDQVKNCLVQLKPLLCPKFNFLLDWCSWLLGLQDYNITFLKLGQQDPPISLVLQYCNQMVYLHWMNYGFWLRNVTKCPMFYCFFYFFLADRYFLKQETWNQSR